MTKKEIDKKTKKTSSVAKTEGSFKPKLKTQKRKIFGRKIKKLREKGILPANIYGKKIKSQAIEVDLKEFLTVYQEAGETGIVELSLSPEKKSRAVLIHNLQKDPVTDLPLHADFHQIDLKEKVHVAIPIELRGEAPAVSKGGILVPLMDEIEVEALPTDLPEKFEVDISKIDKIGQGIALKDLKVDKAKVKILVENEEDLLVKVEEPKEEKEEEKPTEEVPAEGEEAEVQEGEEKEETGKPEEGKKEVKPEEKQEKQGKEEKK